MMGLIMGICQVAEASPANLINNSTFDMNVNGWNGSSCRYGSCAWDNTQNSVGWSTGSGSLRLQSPSSSIALDVQCVNVTPNTNYGMGGWVLFPTIQKNASTIESYAQIRVDFYSGPDCGGPFAGGTEVLYAFFSDVWTHKRMVAVSPPAAKSARVQAYIFPNGANSSLYAYFDGIFFGDSIFADGFQ